MREEKRWLRHENGLCHFSLLAAKLISNPDVKVGSQRSLRSSKKYLIENPKISVNPSLILQPILAK